MTVLLGIRSDACPKLGDRKFMSLAPNSSITGRPGMARYYAMMLNEVIGVFLQRVCDIEVEDGPFFLNERYF